MREVFTTWTSRRDSWGKFFYSTDMGLVTKVDVKSNSKYNNFKMAHHNDGSRIHFAGGRTSGVGDTVT